MGCCNRRKVEDGRPKRWVQERKSYYNQKCLPPPIVLFLVALGVLLAVVLLGLTIFFVFFWPLPTRPYGIHVAKFGHSVPPGGWVIVQTPPPVTGQGGGGSNNNGDDVTQDPYGNTTTCVDFEPYLCGLVPPDTVCANTYGRAYCCDTCNVDASCRDTTRGCYLVWFYGLCVKEEYKKVCCVTCTEGGVEGPPF